MLQLKLFGWLIQKFLESPKISETNLRCDEKIFDQRQKSFCTRVAIHRLSDKHFMSSTKNFHTSEVTPIA